MKPSKSLTGDPLLDFTVPKYVFEEMVDGGYDPENYEPLDFNALIEPITLEDLEKLYEEESEL